MLKVDIHIYFDCFYLKELGIVYEGLELLKNPSSFYSIVVSLNVAVALMVPCG